MDYQSLLANKESDPFNHRMSNRKSAKLRNWEEETSHSVAGACVWTHTHTHTHTENITVLFVVALIALDPSSSPFSRVPFFPTFPGTKQVPANATGHSTRAVHPTVHTCTLVYLVYVFRRLSPLRRGILSLLFSSLLFSSLLSCHSLRSERESKKETTFYAWQVEDEVIDGSNPAWAWKLKREEILSRGRKNCCLDSETEISLWFRKESRRVILVAILLQDTCQGVANFICTWGEQYKWSEL